MRISHEAIYQALYVQGRGALQAGAGRVPAHRAGAAGPASPRRRARQGFVTDEVMISERPAEAEDRAVPGHWEGDLILGIDQLRDRHAGGAHDPVHDAAASAADDRRPARESRTGPPLAGHGAEAVRDAIAAAIITLPEQLRRSLTWDQGAEMAQHAQLRIDTGLPVYFCDPQSPWQRGTNENTNGLLRQYFPKGTDLARHSAEDLAAVAAALNSRPRKTLGWRTPAEALNDHQRLTSHGGAAGDDRARRSGLGRRARGYRRCGPPSGGPARRQPRRSSSPSGSRRRATSGVTTTSSVTSVQPLLRGPVEPEQFTAVLFTKRCAKAGIEVSMGSVGDCYDNAVCETFHASLKKEKIYRQSWPTRAAARTAVFEYIEGWYNPRRRHSTLGYLSPIEFERHSHRARSTGARGPDFAQRIGRVDRAEGLTRAYNASRLDRRRRFRCPRTRSLPRTASSSQPVPLRPRRKAVKGRTAAGGLSDP